MPTPSLRSIFNYALCFNGYRAWGEFRALGEMANDKLFFHSEHGLWMGTARELRACLFFEQRRWRHFGHHPEGSKLEAIVSLFDRIQCLVKEGDFAPNDPPSVSLYGVPAMTIDGVGARLLEWNEDEGLMVMVALDESGEVMERRCPPSIITPDDPKLISQLPWLFGQDTAINPNSH